MMEDINSFFRDKCPLPPNDEPFAATKNRTLFLLPAIHSADRLSPFFNPDTTTMNNTYIHTIAKELSISPKQVSATARLLDEGGTVPFISRYRKEATGSLDEIAVSAVRDRLGELAELDKRRDAILASLTERDLLTDDLKKAITGAADKTTLEDIYLPHRPKRRTRGSMARERGLEPLATCCSPSADRTRQARPNAL